MSSSIRFRGGNRNNIIEIAKNLDAFRKVPTEYVETTTVGGTISLISRLLILFLIYTEFKYYQESNLIYTFKPDIDLDTKIRMNVDVTIAMPCSRLSAVDLITDIKQDVFSPGILKREPTWWELDAAQQKLFNQIQYLNVFLREEYHSVADLIFKDILLKDTGSLNHDLPERTTKPNKPEDACRVHGSFLINKVGGVLHFVAGENILQIGFIDNQIHLFKDYPAVQLNFTHRINKLSFGDYASRIVQPLEGDEKAVNHEKAVMQYVIDIVPTEIHNTFTKINTYQYSVKENLRNINSQRTSSYSIPGIYFKYNWSPLKVIVTPDRDNLIQFIIRLCSIISGIVVISGVLNSLLNLIQKCIISAFASNIFISSQQQNHLDQKEIIKTNIPGANILLKNSLLIETEEESLPLLVH